MTYSSTSANQLRRNVSLAVPVPRFCPKEQGAGESELKNHVSKKNYMYSGSFIDRKHYVIVGIHQSTAKVMTNAFFVLFASLAVLGTCIIG